MSLVTVDRLPFQEGRPMDMTSLHDIREAVIPEEDDDYDLKEPVEHLVRSLLLLPSYPDFDCST